MLRAIVLAGLCTVAGAASIAAQESAAADAERVRVMVLGTFHFTGTPEFNDVMAAEQQAEIGTVVDALAAFRPTKLALEEVPADSAHLDSLYRAYRAGNHELTANERQQLGFRLADRFDHDRVYSIDRREPWPNAAAMDWARENRPGFLDDYERWRERKSAESDSLHRNATIGEILRRMNTDAYLRDLEALRMRKVELGAGTDYPGVGPTLSMYERDLKILANLTRIAEPGDRIIVIYGAGHAYHLRDFVRNHPGMEFVDPADYLPTEGDAT